MLKNYFTIALRTLKKNKIFTAINILGLSIGISASLVIYLLVNYHFTFDQFEKDGDRIYRVVTKFKFSGEVYHNSGVPMPMGPAIKKELTGLETVVPFRTWIDQDDHIKVEVKGIDNKPTIYKSEMQAAFVDENYFGLIRYNLLAGNYNTMSKQPYQVVLTERKAKMYFPTLNAADIIGKELLFNDTIRTTVTGVVEDIKYNTDFDFTIFISLATLENTGLKPNDWGRWDNTNGASQLYVKLSRGTSPTYIEKQIANLFNKYHLKEADDHSTTEHLLQPLNTLHFNADYGGYNKPLANKPTLYSLLAVAGFLLLLGCINFINLTTANASQRAKEIGIRKTMGSSRKQLIIQFFLETFLLTFLATLLSVCLTPLILNAFSGFIPVDLNFNLVAQPGIIAFLILLIIAVTLLSGFYPALVLSGYKPVQILKNQVNTTTGLSHRVWLRKSLTVSQFVIAQVFIMATILVSKQISYVLNKDMGFKKDAIIYFPTNFYDTVQSNRFFLADKLRAIPEVQAVSLSSNPPSSNSTWSGSMKYFDGKKEIDVDVQQKYADTGYLKLYGFKLLAGSNLAHADTVKEFLINETFARVLGFQKPEQALGRNITWSNRQIPVAGVIADFNQKSLHEAIKPLVISTWKNTARTINIALQPQNTTGTTWKTAISKIEHSFKEVYPEDDFDYSFFDQEIEKYYDNEKNVSRLLMWATGLAVFISCLGLLGLVLYTTTQRTKEIGVRKVLGASVIQIVSLISKDFLLLILLAFVIAAPLAWIGMSKWLQNFAYQTKISWWIFLLGGSLMLIIAFVTLTFQTAKAALANPVKSLRSE